MIKSHDSKGGLSSMANFSRLARRSFPAAVIIVLIVFFTYRPPTRLQQYLPETVTTLTNPMVNTFTGPHQRDSDIWFIGTVTPAHGLMRRQLIRETWQKLYRHRNIFTTRFILSNPGEVWRPFVERENATYGDLIILEHLEENPEVANSNKSIEFIKYIASQGRTYQFVSKLDDDSFLDAPTFYKDYLQPIVSRENMTIEPRTIIGRKTKETIYKFPYPGGQFYTMTWDIVKLLAKLHRENPPDEKYEDVLIGRLLHEAREEWFFTELHNRAAFDFEYPDKDEKGKTVWAKPNTNLEAYDHPIGEGSINPHKLKDDTLFLKVAACYGPNGLLHPPNEE
jgi:hypothetical protein